MTYMRNLLPPSCIWFAFGISQHQFPMAAQAALLGGHIRVGLEDNLYLDKGDACAEQRGAGGAGGEHNRKSRGNRRKRNGCARDDFAAQDTLTVRTTRAGKTSGQGATR